LKPIAPTLKKLTWQQGQLKKKNERYAKKKNSINVPHQISSKITVL
jgi:hypothetical protein